MKKDKHLQTAIGRKVEIKLFKPVDNRRELEGILDHFDSERIAIMDGDTIVTLKRTDVAVIRLAIDF